MVAFSEDFERDPFRAGWTCEKRGARAGEAKWLPGDDGDRCIEVAHGQWRGPGIRLEPGGLYRFACRSRAAHKGYWGVLTYDASDAEIPASPYSGIPESPDWTTTEAVVLVPQEARDARVLLWPRGEPMQVDDIVIERVTHDHAREIIDRTYDGLPPVSFRPPEDRWEHLPRCRAILEAGGDLTVLVVGDSVVNDLAHSQFHLLVERAWPGSAVTLYNEVGSGARPGAYLEGDHLGGMLRDRRPDLVVFGGMSTREQDLPDLRRLAALVDETDHADFLAVTGTILVPRYWEDIERSAAARQGYRQGLIDTGRTDGFAVFDIGSAWETYARDCGEDIEHFRRDGHHANERGKQVYGRLLAAFLAPPGGAIPTASRAAP